MTEPLKGNTCVLTNLVNNYPNCAISGNTYSHPEAIYKVWLHEGNNNIVFTLKVGEGKDLALVLRTACLPNPDPRLDTCVRSADGAGHEIFALPRNFTPGFYYLYIDAAVTGRGCGPYELTVTGTNPVPDLDVGLTSKPKPSVVAGNFLTYTLTVDNGTALEATGVTVTATLPAGVSVPMVSGCTVTGTPTTQKKVVCKISLLPKGGHFEKTFAVTVAPATRGSVKSMATATANEGDQNPANNEESDSTNVITRVDLSVEKTVSPAEAVAGEPLIYRLRVRNSGPSDATDVVVTDPLPSGLTFLSSTSTDCLYAQNVNAVTCRIPSVIASNNPLVFVDRFFTVMVQPALGDGSFLENTATVTAREPEPDPPAPDLPNAGTSRTHVIRKTDLSITKIAPATPSEVRAGEPLGLTYQFAVCNCGPSNSAKVTLTDDLATLPPGVGLRSPANGCVEDSNRKVTCSIGPMAAQQCLQDKRCNLNSNRTKFLSYVVDVPSSLPATILSNTVSITALEADPNSLNNTSTDSTTVRIEADLSAERTDLNAGKTARGISDFGVTEEAVAGANLVYAVGVRNNGPSDSPGGEIRDVLRAGLSFVASPDGCHEDETNPEIVICPLPPLPAGGSRVFRFVAKIPVEAPESFENRASVEGVNDPEDDNDLSNLLSTTVTHEADLAVTLSEDRDPVVLSGDRKLGYMIDVTNAGPSNAAGVKVLLELPEGAALMAASDNRCGPGEEPGFVECSLDATLPTGGNASFNIPIFAPNRRGTAKATAKVSAETADPNPNLANNTAMETTTLAEGTDADIAVIKTAGVKAVVPGGLIPYRIEVVNRGPAEATEVVVTDDLPAMVTLDSVVPPEPVCTIPFGDVVRCGFSPLGAGAKRTIDLTVRVSPNFAGSLVENIARNLAPDSDPNPANNSGTVRTPVLDIAPLVLPFFKADSEKDDTLFAVRNPSEEEVAVRLDYFLPGDPDPQKCDHVCLQRKQTVTRSLRDRLLGEGYVGITPIEECLSILCTPTSPLSRLASPPEPPLSGDFIRIIRAELPPPPGHASGQPLVSADTTRVPPELCRRWSVRFLNGGSFGGSTELFFFVPGNAVGNDPVAVGKVYNEKDGKFVQEISIRTSEKAFRRTTQAGFDNPDPSLPPVPLLASFGAIEWEFPNGVGNVSAIHRNEDNLAVAVPGFCRDGDRSTVSPLLVPYFEVEPAGKTTLFAVRNESDDGVKVHYEYFSDRGVLSAMSQTVTLPAHAANTVNLRFADPPPGVTKGYIQVVAESLDGQPAILSGDFVRVDSATGLASGGPLVDEDPLRSPPQLCRSWNVRFLQGVPAGSTTDFVFHVSTGSPGTIEGQIYDETGAPKGKVRIPATLSPFTAFQVSASQLEAVAPPLELPGNGSIEWDLGEGVSGNVASILKSTTPINLSVLAPGVCLPEPP